LHARVTSVAGSPAAADAGIAEGGLGHAGKKRLVLLAAFRVRPASSYRAGAERWAAALCVIALALVLVPTATSAPNTKFVSKQYGYSIVLPGSTKYWRSSFAIITWSAGSPQPGSPAFDTYTDLRVNRLYLIAARRLPTGSTLAKWTTFAKTPGALGCKAQSSLPNSTLAGAPARVFTYTCSDVYGIGITALHNHLGYLMLVSSRPGTPRASERSAFNTAQASFRFLPK
jgi:hypothetical protein